MHVPHSIQEQKKMETTSIINVHEHPGKAWRLQLLLQVITVRNLLATSINPH